MTKLIKAEDVILEIDKDVVDAAFKHINEKNPPETQSDWRKQETTPR